MPGSGMYSALIDGQYGSAVAAKAAAKRREEARKARLARSTQSKGGRTVDRPAPHPPLYYTGMRDPGRHVKDPHYVPKVKAGWASEQQVPFGGGGVTGGTGGTGGGWETPAPPPGGGKVTWSEFGYDIENAPAAWRALKPSKLDARSEWFATMNMMIPFLAPDQQAAMGQMLAQKDTEHFGHLAGMSPGGQTLDKIAAQQEKWGGRRALMQAQEALSRFRGAMGTEESKMGEGYRYIEDMISRIADFSGGGSPQSRLDYTRMMSQLEPMLQGAPNEYKGLAEMFLNPGFQRGVQMGDQWQWGTPHKELWG